jgi:hypothetical protein
MNPCDAALTAGRAPFMTRAACGKRPESRVDRDNLAVDVAQASVIGPNEDENDHARKTPYQ